jgi:hypothetical protein
MNKRSKHCKFAQLFNGSSVTVWQKETSSEANFLKFPIRARADGEI